MSKVVESVREVWSRVNEFRNKHVFGWWKDTVFEYYVLSAKVIFVVSCTFLIPMSMFYLIDILYSSDLRVYVDMILRDAQKGAGG